MIPLIKNTFLNEKETKKALADFIVRTDKLSMGEKCAAFEKAFAKKQGRKKAVLFNSGGSANLALLQALKNLGRIKEGDKIGFSALTWSTNVMPIIMLGMKPVSIDVDKATLNIMSSQLKERLNEIKLRVLFITNALGFTGDLDEIRNICKQKNIILLEDNCESLGTALVSDKAGNFGLAGTSSFFVAHHMSTIEGGMVYTDDEYLAEMLVILRANGWDRNLTPEQQNRWRKKHKITSEFQAKYTFYDLGFNLRPTEITGFLGLSQLKYLDANTKKRMKNFLRFDKATRSNDELIPVERAHIKTASAFALPVICKTSALKKKYQERFMKTEIEIRPMIAGNIQKQPFYKKYVEEKYDLPNSDFLHENSFYCGNYPELSEEDLDIICECLKN